MGTVYIVGIYEWVGVLYVGNISMVDIFQIKATTSAQF